MKLGNLLGIWVAGCELVCFFVPWACGAAQYTKKHASKCWCEEYDTARANVLHYDAEKVQACLLRA